MRTTHARSATPALAAALTGLLALAACGTSEEDAPAGSVSTDSEAQVSITDPWVKAADEGMTAAFGTITNPGEEDVVVTAADTGVSTVMELHEMATGDSGEMVIDVFPTGQTNFINRSRTRISDGGDYTTSVSHVLPSMRVHSPGQMLPPTSRPPISAFLISHRRRSATKTLTTVTMKMTMTKPHDFRSHLSLSYLRCLRRRRRWWEHHALSLSYLLGYMKFKYY